MNLECSIKRLDCIKNCVLAPAKLVFYTTQQTLCFRCMESSHPSAGGGRHTVPCAFHGQLQLFPSTSNSHTAGHG